jgi:hypothetical protein
MQIRIRDKKIQAAIKREAKKRDCSKARAVEMILTIYYAKSA